jgi:hypothetical protein
MTSLRLFLLLTVGAIAAHAQNFDLAFVNAVTAPAFSQPMRGAAVNQFHQLTVIVHDITSGSCTGGWSGVIVIEASQDNTNYAQLGLAITAVTTSAPVFISAAGTFQYIRIAYLSGSTSTCALTAWYSGSPTGYPTSSSSSGAIPVYIIGNSTISSGQQAVTALPVALASQISKQACVHALSTNTISVFIGPAGVTTSTGLELVPDEAVCLPVANLNEIYVVASTTGATVTWASTY